MSTKRARAFDPDWVIAPSESLREWLDHSGVKTVRIAASAAGAERKERAAQLIQDVLDRKPLTAEHAHALAQASFIPAQFWLNLEQQLPGRPGRGKEGRVRWTIITLLSSRKASARRSYRTTSAPAAVAVSTLPTGSTLDTTTLRSWSTRSTCALSWTTSKAEPRPPR